MGSEWVQNMRGRLRGARVKATEYIIINTRLCRACWKCIRACPRGVIGKVDFLFHKHIRLIEPDLCVGCGACEKACPEGAIAALKRSKRQGDDQFC
ncbi:hypothetical protein Desru_1538 [Desulforamulus ruminis DSM 2154]|uniref:4Fe-4S ferredoxin-type domain-containing protein n=2 Tax=Desulforamulus ruminis TaxID=1564 RepID=F6DRP2_DESRL|nr:hypothetical protein Desru_1538 [Desulforamulus ruminis DSM 2154]